MVCDQYGVAGFFRQPAVAVLVAALDFEDAFAKIYLLVIIVDCSTNYTSSKNLTANFVQ